MSYFRNNSKAFRVGAVIAILILGLGCGAVQSAQLLQDTPVATDVTDVPTAPSVSSSAAPTAVSAPTDVSPAPSGQPGELITAVRQVSQHVKPAVVQITNEQVQFGQFNQPFSVPAGVGSGVIYDNQGHILTNNHVVEGAQNLLVSLPDGRSFKAKLIGADPATDLAVVQISGSNLPVAQLGNSRQLQVGDWVVAIGNALALPGGPTVTEGVVSALGRTVQEPGDSNSNAPGPYLFDLVQTSAPINPGNSGGPLVNLSSQVVGIDTLVAGEAQPGVPSQGIGFAISIDTAKPIADQLVATGHIDHAFLGIEYVPLNPAISAQLGVQQTDGAVVQNVVSGSPAEQAGLRQDDVIIAFDNTPLKGESALAQMLSGRKPNDVVTLTVLRGNRTLNVKAKLGTLPS